MMVQNANVFLSTCARDGGECSISRTSGRQGVQCVRNLFFLGDDISYDVSEE